MATLFEGFDQQAPGLTAPVIATLFNMRPSQTGLFFSITTFGMMLGALVGGRLSDRIGRKTVLVSSIAAFGAFSVLTPLSASIPILLLIRFATGLGLGGALPNLVAIAVESVPPRERHTAIGVLLASPPLGGALASAVAAFASGPSNWPIVYYVGGLVPLLVIVPVLMVFLPSTSAFAQERSAVSNMKAPGIFTTLFRDGQLPRTLFLWTSFFSVLLVLFVLLNWLPSLMIARGLERSQASIVQLAFNVGAIPGSLFAGFALDRAHRRSIPIIGIFVAAGAAISLLASSPGLIKLILLAGGVAGVAVTAAQTVVYALAPTCYPRSGRGIGVGSAVAIGRIGAATGPLYAGYVVGQGKTPEVVLFALLPILLIAGVATVLVNRSNSSAT